MVLYIKWIILSKNLPISSNQLFFSNFFHDFFWQSVITTYLCLFTISYRFSYIYTVTYRKLIARYRYFQLTVSFWFFDTSWRNFSLRSSKLCSLSVTFTTKVYHPNIDTSGRICLDLLKPGPTGTWKPQLNITVVLKAIRQLLSEPNPRKFMLLSFYVVVLP